jgi:hypothetical protein
LFHGFAPFHVDNFPVLSFDQLAGQSLPGKCTSFQGGKQARLEAVETIDCSRSCWLESNASPIAHIAFYPQIIVKCIEFVQDADFEASTTKRLAGPLVTLLSLDHELQYVTLRNIILLLQVHCMFVNARGTLPATMCQRNSSLMLMLVSSPSVSLNPNMAARRVGFLLGPSALEGCRAHASRVRRVCVFLITTRVRKCFVQKYPDVMRHELKVFFVKYNDPIYVKMEKLDIMVWIMLQLL